MDYQRQFLDHFALIQTIVRQTGRRRHFSAVEQEDLAGFVNLRFVDDNYAILRKFRHRSAIATYLTAVIGSLASDFRIERWGKWRSSAAAARLGPAAELLERLVHHDLHTLEEAVEIVRENHGVALTHAEIRALWAQLPGRTKPLEVSEEEASAVAAADRSDVYVEDETHKQDIERLERTLTSALEAMPDQDRVAIALRFDQGLTVAEIARLLGVSVGTVHRRLEFRIRELRGALSKCGVDGRLVRRLIGHPYIALSPLLRREVENFKGSVRLFNRDE